MSDYNPIYPSYPRVRLTTATNTPAAVKTSGGTLHRLNITNLHSAAIFVKIFDKAVADVTVGTTVPVNIFQVAANSQLSVPLDRLPLQFGTAITVAVTTGGADSNAVAAGTLPIIEAEVE